MRALLQSTKHFAAAAALFGSTFALATPVYVQVGQTKVVTVSRDVKVAKASDPALVDVSRKGGGRVVLTGKELGRTAIRLRTSDGEEYTLALHVVPEGATVYSTSREAEGNRLERTAKQTVMADADKAAPRDEAQAAQAETDLESWAGAQP